MLFPTAGFAAMPDQQPSRVALTQMIFVSFLSQLGPSHFCLIDSQQFCVVAQKLGLCAASGVRRSGRDEICGKRAVDDEAALSADGENGQRVFDPLQHARIALIGPAGVLKTPRLSTIGPAERDEQRRRRRPI
jgi:hypothetical protein